MKHQTTARTAATLALAALMAASSTPAAAVAASAVQAGLGHTVAEQASADRSATVAKSGAQALLASLGAAPAGKKWSWSVDSPASTKQEAYYKTSDGQEFDSEAEAKAYCAEAKVTVEQKARSVA